MPIHAAHSALEDGEAALNVVCGGVAASVFLVAVVHGAMLANWRPILRYIVRFCVNLQLTRRREGAYEP
jgi:hypothetical protein